LAKQASDPSTSSPQLNRASSAGRPGTYIKQFLVVETRLLRKHKCFAGILAMTLTTILLATTLYERPTHPVLHGHGIIERQLGPDPMCLKFILRQIGDICRKFFNVSLAQSVPLFSSAAKISSTESKRNQQSVASR
jgi:hypothetical protein